MGRQTAGKSVDWWLCSPSALQTSYGYRVHYNGLFDDYNNAVYNALGLRLASNLTESSIFESSGNNVYTFVGTTTDYKKVEFSDDSYYQVT